jgi:translocation and assembly module TamA
MPENLWFPVFRCCVVLLSTLVSPAVFCASAAIVLEGPDDLAQWMTPYLPEEGVAVGRLETMLREMLATEGYFLPTFTITGTAKELHVRFDPGPRVLVAGVDLAVDGTVAEETKKSLIAAWRLPAGQAFRQQDWSEAKQQMLAGLLAVTHADARLVDSAAEIDAETQRAYLTARYDAGPPYRFGALRVHGLYRHPVSLIGRYNRAVETGAPYREEDLAALRSALVATPYFASAVVTLDRGSTISEADGTRVAPVDVTVRERPAHRLSFGAGASSNTGARVEAAYHTPNLFNQSWVLDSGLRVEQKQRIVYADVTLPPDEKNRHHAFGAMIETTDIEGLRTNRQALGLRTIQPRGSVERRLSLNWERERRRPEGEKTRITRTLAPDVQWTWRHVDDLLDPRRGTVLQARIGGGAKALLSEQNFLRLYARWQQYVPLGERDSLAVRVDAGVTLAPSRDGIPQTYLFRAGGTGSVRGYAYQSLGVKEGSATVGGRYLAVASIEATHWITPSWGIAAFVDAGDAADRRGDLDPAVGFGLGVRWKSPAGPIGADLAYGRRSRELHVHFALAIPF